MGDGGYVAMSMIIVSVSVANNFVHSSTGADHGYRSFGELARFIFCLLLKTKKASLLPLAEQREKYVTSNPWRFLAIDEKIMVSGTGVIAALDNVESHYLLTECRLDARRCLEEFVVDCCFEIARRTGYEPLLPCNCG